MKETEWAKMVAEKLDSELSGFNVEAGKNLIYANEIVEYGENENGTSYNKMAYETDILIYEKTDENKWKPRVVIETKVNSVSTHDSITYSQKSATHKYVHPYLRYGIFLGNRGSKPLPGRLFRHGVHFDFMLSWVGYKPKEDEWKTSLCIIKKEIEASKKLEKMIFNSRSKQREKYIALHKPLVTLSQLTQNSSN
jgi:hypothetical protein